MTTVRLGWRKRLLVHATADGLLLTLRERGRDKTRLLDRDAALSLLTALHKA